MKAPNVAIVCNSYPTKKNATNQIFIKNLVMELNRQSIIPYVYYNPIYNYWGNASNSKNLLSNIIKYSFFTIGILRLIIRIKSYDLLNPHGVMPSGFVSVFIKRFFNIPVAIHIHGGDLNLYKSSNMIYKKIYDFTISNSDIVIVNSNNIKRKLLELTGITPSKLTVISPGIDYKKFYRMDIGKITEHKKTYGIHDDKTVLLFAGNAIKRKGLDILVNALNLLTTKDLEKIFLIICSEGPEISTIKTNLDDIKGIKDSVIFLKKVDQPGLRILYNIATIFIFPSREEPLGLVGLESIACGTPVIGSNVGGIPEYINKNNGLLFDPNEPKELASIISTVLNNQKVISSFNNKIDKRKAEHDINITVKRLIDIFCELQKKSFLEKK